MFAACPTTIDLSSVLVVNSLRTKQSSSPKQALISSQIKRVVLLIIRSGSALVHVVAPPALAGRLWSATGCSARGQRSVGP